MKKLLFTFFILLAPTIVDAATIGKVNANNIGLVGYWTFDGADLIPRVMDKSGSGNNARLLNAVAANGGWTTGTTTSSGRFGQALQFASISANYAFVSSSALNLTTTNTITVSAWIKPSTNTGSQWIINNTNNCQNSSDGEQQYLLAINQSSRFRFLIATGVQDQMNVADSSAVITPGEWYLLTGVVDANNVYLYVNGVLVATTARSITPLSVSSVYMGGLCNSTNHFVGSLDDVRTYNRALTATEVKALYNSGSAKVASSNMGSTTAPLSNGLVGYWTLDGSKTNWATGKTLDSSGIGSTGQLVNISTSTSPLVGKIGQALTFNGSTSYLQADTNLPSIGSEDRSVSLWEKTTSTAAMIAYSQSNDVGGSVRLELDFNSQTTDAATVACRSDGHSFTNLDKATDGSTTYRDGQWHHFVGIMAATELRLYRDGVLVGTGPRTAPLCGGSITTTKQTIGAVAAGGYSIFFNGSVDDVRVYNRALSAQEVLNLYNSSIPKIASSNPGTVTPLGSGLVGYWTFDGSKTNWATNKTFDSSGSANTGTLFRLATTTAPIQGKFGQALDFSQNNTSVIRLTSDPIGTSAATICMWLYPYRYPAAVSGLFDASVALLHMTSSGGFQFSSDGTNLAPSAGGALPKFEWSYACATRDAAGIANLYVNGVRSGTANQNSGTPLSGGTIRVGNIVNETGAFAGKIDDLRIYNRVLSPTEIQQLYNMSK